MIIWLPATQYHPIKSIIVTIHTLSMGQISQLQHIGGVANISLKSTKYRAFSRQPHGTSAVGADHAESG
jgi:hypothetical protein